MHLLTLFQDDSEHAFNCYKAAQEPVCMTMIKTLTLDGCQEQLQIGPA